MKRGAGRPVPRCLVCGAIVSPIPTARCLACERRARAAGGVVLRRAKVIGYDRRLVGRVVVEQGKPRTTEAAAMIREHLAWLQSNRPASTGRRGDVAGSPGNSSGARASDNPDELRQQQADAWLLLAGRTAQATR